MLLFIQRPFNTFLQVKEVDEEISLTLLEIFVTFVLAIFFSQDKLTSNEMAIEFIATDA